MALVEVNHLKYRYPDGTVALAGVSFRVDDGQRVGLVGPNGAGKSTLLWHLNGLLPERFGGGLPRGAGRNGRAGEGGAGRHLRASVCVGDLPVTEANLAAIRRAVGLVFQDPDDQLFCPLVREDVAFGPLNQGLAGPEAMRRVRAALSAVGLEGYEERLAHRLSVGQRKRVCLAGVLACEPRLLALDEPTANLDPRARRQLAGVLGTLDCAQLIASHDLELVRQLSTRVILLDEGRIHADGPARDILADEPLLVAHGLEVPPGLR